MPQKRPAKKDLGRYRNRIFAVGACSWAATVSDQFNAGTPSALQPPSQF
jgi:hypothetical protein